VDQPGVDAQAEVHSREQGGKPVETNRERKIVDMPAGLRIGRSQDRFVKRAISR